MKQLPGGEELQEDESDAVLKHCEQLSLKLREALQIQDTDRLCTGPTGHEI